METREDVIKSLASNRPFKIEVGGHTFKLQRTLEAADTIEELFNGPLNAMRNVADGNRSATAQILVMCSKSFQIPPEDVRAHLFTLGIVDRSAVFNQVSAYLGEMANGFVGGEEPEEEGEEETPGN